MYRPSSSRNQRSKGIKLKHILQILLLLAVCFWLIYQFKHSHGKKKEFDETNDKILVYEGILGRKGGIEPLLKEPINKDEKHDEDSEEDEPAGEEDKNEERLGEKKPLDKEDGGEEGGGDDEDEHEQGKSDTEVDGEEDFLQDEKEGEDGDENESVAAHGNGEVEKESSLEQKDRGRDDAEEAHEAREENYKADDASSAVTHEVQTGTTENKKERVENSNRPPGNISEQENKENNDEETGKSEDRKDLEVEGGDMNKNEDQSNEATAETKEIVLVDSEDDSTPNNTATELSGDRLEASNENLDLFSQNATGNKPDLTVAERSNHTTLDEESIRSGLHLSFPAETKDAESNSVSSDISTSGTVPRPEDSRESGNVTSSMTENDELEKAFIREGTEDGLESEATENIEEFQHDFIDISDKTDSLEEKHVRTDLETLPDIQTEGTDSEDVAE